MCWKNLLIGIVSLLLCQSSVCLGTKGDLRSLSETSSADLRKQIRVFTEVSSIEGSNLMKQLRAFHEDYLKQFEISFYFRIPHEKSSTESQEEDSAENETTIQTHCYGDGAYCDFDNPTSLREIIRQECIAQLSLHEFIVYSIAMGPKLKEFTAKQLKELFYNGDQEYFDFDKESLIALAHTKINSDQLQSCFDNSFKGLKQQESNGKLFMASNEILLRNKQQFEAINNRKDVPIVQLNGVIVEPSSTNYIIDVTRAICKSQQSSTEGICSEYQIQQEGEDASKGLSGTEITILAVSLLVVIGIVGLVLIRRYRKTCQPNSKQQWVPIEDSAPQSQYIELKSEKHYHDDGI